MLFPGRNATNVAALGGAPVVADSGFTVLPTLDAASKVVSAWILPGNNPAQYLTLNGAAVEGWAAAYGTQKVDLVELTNPPAWDATLFSNKGGVVFDGTNDCLAGTGNVTNWPDNTADLYMLVAMRQDFAAGTAGSKVALSYGAASTTSRTIGRAVVSATNRVSNVAGVNTANGASVDLSGAHTIGFVVDVGGTSTNYVDGAADGSVSTASASLTRTRVRIGALAGASATLFWRGSIVAAAILDSTASLQDFLDLEAEFRARLA